jgi:hypothetical protein
MPHVGGLRKLQHITAPLSPVGGEHALGLLGQPGPRPPETGQRGSADADTEPSRPACGRRYRIGSSNPTNSGTTSPNGCIIKLHEAC